MRSSTKHAMQELKPRHCRCARTVWLAGTGYFCLSGGGITFDKYAPYRLQLPRLVCRAIIRFYLACTAPRMRTMLFASMHACIMLPNTHTCLRTFFCNVLCTHTRVNHTCPLTRIYSLLTKPPSRSFAPSRSVPSLPPSLPPSLLLPLPIPLPITAALRSNIRGSGGLCVALEPTEQILSQNQTRK